MNLELRIWDIKNEIMIYQDDLIITLDKDGLNIDHCTDDRIINIKKDFKVMLYTGLKDKKGTKIYAGDIIETCDHKLMVVIWKNNGFKLEYKFISTYYGESYYDTTLLELNNTDCSRWGMSVVGNIEQDLNLLNA